MKAIKILIVALLIGFSTANAQVSVNVNIGAPPVWAPAPPAPTQYYYLPDIDVYYDVPAERYIYINNGVWIHSVNLPYRYRDYVYHNPRVVYLTDYRGNAPYTFHKTHYVKYKGNNGNHYGHDKGKGKWKNKKGRGNNNDQ